MKKYFVFSREERMGAVGFGDQRIFGIICRGLGLVDFFQEGLWVVMFDFLIFIKEIENLDF